MYISEIRYKITVLIFFITTIVFGGPNGNNNSLWPELQFNYPLNKKYEIGLSQQIRYDLNSNSMKWHVTDLEFSTKLRKRLSLSAKYRYKNRVNANQHGLYADLRYKTKKKPIRLLYRFRYNKQLRFSSENNTTIRKRDEDHIRNRIILEYDHFKNVVPYLGTELFFLINNDKYGSGFDIFRYYLGVEIDTFKRQQLEIRWIIEEVFDLGPRVTENIIKIQYSIDIKK